MAPGAGHLSQGRDADALAAYGDRMRARARDFWQHQAGAGPLLPRMDRAGLEAGDRRAPAGAHLAARAGNEVRPFPGVHHLPGLARAGHGRLARTGAALSPARGVPAPARVAA